MYRNAGEAIVRTHWKFSDSCSMTVIGESTWWVILSYFCNASALLQMFLGQPERNNMDPEILCKDQMALEGVSTITSPFQI